MQASNVLLLSMYSLVTKSVQYGECYLLICGEQNADIIYGLRPLQLDFMFLGRDRPI